MQSPSQSQYASDGRPRHNTSAMVVQMSTRARSSSICWMLVFMMNRRALHRISMISVVAKV